MTKLRRALVVLPSDFSERPGGYVAACQALGLAPNPHGHVLYLAETSAGTRALVRAELGEPGAIQDTDEGSTDVPGSQNVAEQRGRSLISSEDSVREFCSPEPVEPGMDLAGHPSARTVINVSTGRLEGVGVWNPKAKVYRHARLGGAARLEAGVQSVVREAVAEVLAETFGGASWPAPSHSAATALNDHDVLYLAAEILLEPETFLLKMINATARAAAVRAGLGIVASLVGQLAEDMCAPVLRLSPGNQAAGEMVKIIDMDLYAKGARLHRWPDLHRRPWPAVDKVLGGLLASRPGTPPDKSVPPVYPTRPDEPSPTDPPSPPGSPAPLEPPLPRPSPGWGSDSRGDFRRPGPGFSSF
jgi:hypothetical protein